MTVQRVLLLLDRRARNTGAAVVSLGGDQSDAPALAAALDGRKISYFERYGAARYLEVRPSTTAELQTLRDAKAKILRGSRRLAPQAYLGGAAAALEPPGLRDFVVNVNGAAEEVAAGRFALNDLPRGRVDLLARCAAAALFLSHGVRKRSRVWLHLDGHGRTVCFDGGRARGLRPDEVCLASALRTALRGGGDGVGVSVHDDASLESRLAALLGWQATARCWCCTKRAMASPRRMPGRKKARCSCSAAALASARTTLAPSGSAAGSDRRREACRCWRRTPCARFARRSIARRLAISDGSRRTDAPRPSATRHHPIERHLPRLQVRTHLVRNGRAT